MSAAIECADVAIVERALRSAGDDSVNLDLVANAIRPDLLQPYVTPQRPISLGTAATHYTRASYTPRLDVGDSGGDGDSAHTRVRDEFGAADAVALHAVTALAQSIANALGVGVLVNIDWLRPESVAVEATTLRRSVVVCADVLARVADATPLLALLARIQRDAPVLVISVPLREFTLTTDGVGPPARTDRVREWAFPELQALLDSAGLDIVFGGLVPATAFAPAEQTGVFVAIRRSSRV